MAADPNATYTLDEPYRSRMLGWITELESGKYIQGFGRLETTDSDGRVKHCCLGVACRYAMATDLPNLPTVQIPVEEGSTSRRTAFGDGLTTGMLPFEVIEWLSPMGPNGRYVLLQGPLTRMNDDLTHDFPAIAAYLRKRFKLPKES